MIRLGWNGSRQTSLAQVPRNLLLEGFDVPTYRGKRFIEVNSADTTIRNVSVLDAYSPVGQDSQAICVLNTPGKLNFSNLHLQAASNCLMLGGDQPWIPGNHIKEVLIEDCLLDKPLEWKVMGLPVKNHFEIKDGWDVIFRNNILRNCWQPGQGAYGIVLTPSRGSLQNIQIINCDMANVGGCINMAGIDVAGMFPERTQVTVRGGIFRTNKPEMNGTGWFALVGRGVEYFDCFDADIECDHSLIVVDSVPPVDRITMKGSKFHLNKYGISINGHHAQLEHPLINNTVKSLIVEENTISGATAKFKLNFPNNVYV